MSWFSHFIWDMITEQKPLRTQRAGGRCAYISLLRQAPSDGEADAWLSHLFYDVTLIPIGLGVL